MQKPNENVHMYIIKYANLHQTVTGKRPEQETDQSHLTKFLISINNVEISREICRQGIPWGTALTRPLFESNQKGGWTATSRRSCIGPFCPGNGNSR